MKRLAFLADKYVKTNETIKHDLNIFIEYLIKHQDFKVFYFCGFTRFDTACYDIVSNLKLKYPFIKRILCLDNCKYIDQYPHKKWIIDREFEQITQPPEILENSTKRIDFRNYAMIENSDFIFFYINNPKNNHVYRAYQYAVKNNKKLINLMF